MKYQILIPQNTGGATFVALIVPICIYPKGSLRIYVEEKNSVTSQAEDRDTALFVLIQHVLHTGAGSRKLAHVHLVWTLI